MNMSIKIFVFTLLTSSLLSSAMAINVPVFAIDTLQSQNDDGQQTVDINDCNNIQNEFEDSNDNTQDLNCGIINNNLQDVRDTTNTLGNVIPSNGDDDGGNGEHLIECEECFDALSEYQLGSLLVQLIGYEIDDVADLCNALETDVLDIFQLATLLADVGATEEQFIAISECLEKFGIGIGIG